MLVAFNPKTWRDGRAGGTKTDAAAMIDLEQRLSGYTDQEITTLRGDVVSRTTLPINVLDHGVVADRVTADDGAMTSGSNVLSSGSVTFVGSDVGKVVGIAGAGAAGAYLVSTIASVSGGNAHLADNAGTTVSAATWEYGTDDTAAWQALIDAAPAAGRSLYLPPGHESFCQDLNLDGSSNDKSNITVWSHDRTASLIGLPGQQPGNIVQARSGNGFRLRGLKLAAARDRGNSAPTYSVLWNTNTAYTYDAASPLYVSVASDGTIDSPSSSSARVFKLLVSHTSGTNLLDDQTASGDTYWLEITDGSVPNKYNGDAAFDGYHCAYFSGPLGTTGTDGAMTSGSADFTSASTTFTAADVGKIMRVTGAGRGGRTLVSRILSVASHTATLADQAKTTVAAAAWEMGRPVEDVAVEDCDISGAPYAGVLAGSGPEKAGLISSGVYDVEVTNCDIYNCNAAVGGLRRMSSRIEGNRLEAFGNIVNLDAEGSDETVTGNTISGPAGRYAKHGVSSYKSARQVVDGNTIRGCQIGINVSDNGSSASEANAIGENTFLNISNTAIVFNKSPYGSISGGVIRDAAKNGVKINTSPFCTITGVTVQYAGEYGIYLYDSYGVAVGPNVVRFSGKHGLYLNDARKTAITGGVYDDNNQSSIANGSGIYITGSQTTGVTLVGVTARDDQVSKTQTYGLYLDTTASGVHVSGCNFEGNVTGRYSDNGTLNVIGAHRRDSSGTEWHEASRKPGTDVTADLGDSTHRYAKLFVGYEPIIPVRSVSANTSFGTNGYEGIILADASSGTVTLTLPSAATVGAGRRYEARRTNAAGSNVVIATTGGETINGASSFKLTFRGAVVKVISDGTNWRIEQAPAAHDRRRAAMRPSAAIRETIERSQATASSTALTSGRLELYPVWLEGGDVLTGITFVTGATAGASLTHTAFSLYDTDGVTLLKATADDTSASWSSSTAKALAWSGGGTYTVPVDGLYFVGIQVVGTTMPTLCQASTLSTVNGLSPVLAGTSTTGLTDGTPPNPAAAMSAKGGIAYAYVY